MEIVYNGFDNQNTVRISEMVNGVITPFDFTGVTSLELYIPQLNTTISSGVQGGNSDGVVTFTLGDKNLTKGVYLARLVAFDPLHPNGQILVHELSGALRFRVE